MSQPPIDVERERSTGMSIDKVISTEMRRRGSEEAEGLIHTLYDAAYEAEGEPLTFKAAKALHESVDTADVVVITGGAGVWPRLPHGESDGPLGAAAIAGTLTLACGARPIIMTEERNLASYENSVRGCGFNVVSADELRRRNIAKYPAVTVEPYPEEQDAGEEKAETIFAEYDPSAVIGVEKIGPNREEVYHTWYGAEHVGRAKMAPLFDVATDEETLTIGFGDGGNELGMGKIEDEVRDAHPYGETCQCGCGGGVATRVAADHVVVGGTSNWAAYGTAAMLAILSESPDAFHSPDDESRMLEWNAFAGSSDGLLSRPLPMVDGTEKATQTAMVQLLRNIVENRFAETERSDTETVSRNEFE